MAKVVLGLSCLLISALADTDICSESADNDCVDCVMDADPWCANNLWDDNCHATCCGANVYASYSCAEDCAGTSLCSESEATPAPSGDVAYEIMAEGKKCKKKTGPVLTATDLASCAAQCLPADGCAYFSYNSVKAQCLLSALDSCKPKKANNFNVYAIALPFEFYKKKKKCDDGELEVASVGSATACGQRCYDTPDCNFFATNKKGTTCVLYETCFRIKKSKPSILYAMLAPEPTAAPTPQPPTHAPTPLPPTHAPTPAPTPTPAPPTPTQAGGSGGSCGVKGAGRRLRGRVVNGEDATKCEWKWQVALESGYFFCGGTLISTKWVLTAAHCLGGTFNVVLGDYNKDTDDDEVRLDIVNYIPHPSYNSVTMEHDFALLELEEEATLTDCIDIACLPTEDVAAGTSCSITGWGTLSSGGVTPSILQEAEVQTITVAECSEKYDEEITSDMLCASGYTDDGDITDACQGDSGGPLVCKESSEQYVLHGVTSWGYGCASANYPGVWARVYVVKDWIDGIVNA